MAIYTMPVTLSIEADSLEDAQRALEDWANEVDLGSDLPTGTEDLDVSPNCDFNDEGQRILYLPAFEDADEPLDRSNEDNEDNDDFNDGEEDF